MFILTEHPFVFNYCFKKYKNLPVHLSWEAMQRLAASGSYIVVSDYRLGNRKYWKIKGLHGKLLQIRYKPMAFHSD